MSQAAVDLARANAVRNGLEDRMDFVCADVFDLLPTLEGQQDYDFIILDPPAFTKSRKTADNAMRGYKEINYRAMKLLPRGGYLATASCSHFATEEMFLQMLRRRPPGRGAAAAADRGPAAGPRPPHPLERGGDQLSEIFPVPGGLIRFPHCQPRRRSGACAGKEESPCTGTPSAQP